MGMENEGAPRPWGLPEQGTSGMQQQNNTENVCTVAVCTAPTLGINKIPVSTISKAVNLTPFVNTKFTHTKNFILCRFLKHLTCSFLLVMEQAA